METFHSSQRAAFNLEDANGNAVITLSRTTPDNQPPQVSDMIALAITDTEDKETVILLTLEEAQNMANALGYLLI